MSRNRVRILGRKSFSSIRRMLTMENDQEDSGGNLVAEAIQLHKSDPKTFFFEIWGLVMMLAMGYVAFVTPFQIAFMPPLLVTMYTEWWGDKDIGFCNVYNRDDCCNHLEYDCRTQQVDQCYSTVRSGATVIFVFNVLVDILYWVDIFLKLREPYFDEEVGHVVHQRAKIQKHYMTLKYCGVDVITVLPFQMTTDVIILITSLDTGRTTLHPQTIAYLRFFAMIKIQRVMRHYQHFKWMLSDLLNLPLFLQSTLRIFTIIIFVSNLLACLLNIISVLGNPEGEPTLGWYTSKPYLVQVNVAQDCQNPDRIENLWFLWLWSMYWAVMTMTTIGYGDVLPQQNMAELMFVIIAMLVGVILYTLNTGRFLNALMNQELSQKLLMQDLDSISKFVAKNRVPYSMYRTLRSYLRNTQSVRDYGRGLQVVSRLPPGLRDSLARKAFHDKLGSVGWIAPLLGLTAANQHFLGSLLCYMRVMAFPPLERVIQEGEHLGKDKKMFIVNSGLVWSHNSFVRAGGHFGEDMICNQSARYYGASCLTYVQCTTLSRADLFRVLDSCPTYKRHRAHIRYCAVLMALRQMVKQLGHRLQVVRSIARHLAEETGHKVGIKIERCWHENPKKGDHLILFDPDKIQARAATGAKERQEYGDMVLVVNSRRQKWQNVKVIKQKRRFSTLNLNETPFRSRESIRNSQILPIAENMESEKLKAMSDIKRQKLGKVALAKRFSSLTGQESLSRSDSVPAVRDVPVVEVQVMDEMHSRDECNSSEVDGTKPQFRDCMAAIRRSMLSTRRQAKLATLSAPEIVMHIASSLRKHKVISVQDITFVQSTLSDQLDIVERVERIRKHNAEMILSTASDFLQNLLMDRR